MHEVFRLYTPDELGADGYPPEWHETIKHEVRERAGHRCIRCHHPYRNGAHGNGEWSSCDERCDHGPPFRVLAELPHFSVKTGEQFETGYAQISEGVLLHVSSVIARGESVDARWRILTVHHLDGDKANCRWWNLCSLCQRCHLTIQGRVVMERAFMFEHSEWFKPYAAGWYAWKYFGEEITRAEALARQDELLGLERLA